jgi:hypothetical protein
MRSRAARGTLNPEDLQNQADLHSASTSKPKVKDVVADKKFQRERKRTVPLELVQMPPGVKVDILKLSYPKVQRVIGVLAIQWQKVIDNTIKKGLSVYDPTSLRRYQRYLTSAKSYNFEKLDSRSYIMHETQPQKEAVQIRKNNARVKGGLTATEFADVAHKFGVGTLPIDRPELTERKVVFVEPLDVEAAKIGFAELKEDMSLAERLEAGTLVLKPGWVTFGNVGDQIFVTTVEGHESSTQAYMYVDIMPVSTLLPNSGFVAVHNGKILQPWKTLIEAGVKAGDSIRIQLSGLKGGGKTRNPKKQPAGGKLVKDKIRKTKKKDEETPNKQKKPSKKSPTPDRRQREESKAKRCFVCDKDRDHHMGGHFCAREDGANLPEPTTNAERLARRFDDGKPRTTPARTTKTIDERDLYDEAHRRAELDYYQTLEIEAGSDPEHTRDKPLWKRCMESNFATLQVDAANGCNIHTAKIDVSDDASDSPSNVSDVYSDGESTFINISGSAPAILPTPPVITDDDLVERVGIDLNEICEIKTQHKMWTYARKDADFHRNLRQHFADTYLLSTWLFWPLFFVLFTLTSFEIIKMFYHMFYSDWMTFIAFMLLFTFSEVLTHITLKVIRWRPWNVWYNAKERFYKREELNDAILLTSLDKIVNLNRVASYTSHIVQTPTYEAKSKFFILTDPDVVDALDASIGEFEGFSRPKKAAFYFLRYFYSGLIYPSYQDFRKKSQYVSVSQDIIEEIRRDSEGEIVQVIDFDASTLTPANTKCKVDMRAHGQSLQTIKHHDPRLRDVIIAIGRRGTAKFETVRVSMELITQAVSNPSFYEAQTMESLASRINMFVRNTHFINLSRTLNLKDNVIGNSLLVIKYYMSYKIINLAKFDVSKNIELPL